MSNYFPQKYKIRWNVVTKTFRHHQTYSLGESGTNYGVKIKYVTTEYISLCVSFSFNWHWTVFPCNIASIISYVIRQKGKSQSGCFNKSQHANFSENEHFLLPNNLSENLACFVFLNAGFEIRPFALLPTM